MRAYLANKLHVTVLNTVVHHLDVMASTLITDPLATWLAIRLGRDGLEDILDVWPGLLVSTRHDGWTVSSTLLAARDTGTNESDALLCEVLGSAVCVWEVRVSSINDDIALLDATLSQEQLNEVVDWLSGHDQHHHTSWLLQLLHELLNAVGANNALALGFILEETIDLGDCSVEGNDSESVVSCVEDQVLTHDRKANETKVSAIIIVSGLYQAVLQPEVSQ